jgi:hypothetical protein
MSAGAPVAGPTRPRRDVAAVDRGKVLYGVSSERQATVPGPIARR